MYTVKKAKANFVLCTGYRELLYYTTSGVAVCVIRCVGGNFRSAEQAFLTVYNF